MIQVNKNEWYLIKGEWEVMCRQQYKKWWIFHLFDKNPKDTRSLPCINHKKKDYGLSKSSIHYMGQQKKMNWKGRGRIYFKL